ncbi:hypothetical protein AD006_32310 (plasmid) [Pseudonocardia sp. EC080610-09]|nr:hypothetical protein AD006_32310 [Pseudonocardia sp. EC080610-09]
MAVSVTTDHMLGAEPCSTSQQQTVARLLGQESQRRQAEMESLAGQLPGLLAQPEHALRELLAQETSAAGGALIGALEVLQGTPAEKYPGEVFKSCVTTVARHLTTTVALAIALTAQSDEGGA